MDGKSVCHTHATIELCDLVKLWNRVGTNDRGGRVQEAARRAVVIWTRHARIVAGRLQVIRVAKRLDFTGKVSPPRSHHSERLRCGEEQNYDPKERTPHATG